MEYTSAEVIEEYLHNRHASNFLQGMLPSDNAVMERLLKGGDDLRGAWNELLKECPRGIYALGLTLEKWQMVINTIVDVAAGWSPDRVSETRQAVKDVSALTISIQKKASELADLLRQRTRLCDANSIEKKPMDFHPIDLLETAARVSDYASRYGTKHRNFMKYLDGPLTRLTREFGLKYWPTTSDVVEAIAEAQNGAEFSCDRLSDASIIVRQASTRDFMRSLNQSLSDLLDFDIDIRFSDASYAAIVNAACGFDQTIDARSVISYHAAERKRKR